MKIRFQLLWICLVLVTVNLSVADTQEASLDDPPIQLREVRVTAERIGKSLSTSTAAISVLTADEIQRLPVSNLSDALATLPGIAFLNRDGLGRDVMANLRGFYGGGEAEYLLVRMDGIEVNDTETRLMNWNAVPLSGIQSIEFLRGGASSLYGDAAIGGVVNILTNGNETPSTRLSLAGGTFSALNAQFRTHGLWNTRQYTLFAEENRDDGFRDRSERAVENFGGSFSLFSTPEASLSLSTAHNFRRFDEPGPLTEAELANDRSQSSPFYKFDHTTDRKHRVALTGKYEAGADAYLSGVVSGEIRESDVVRTLPLTPEFADTKNRELSTTYLSTSLQFTLDQLKTPLPSKLTLGIDAGLHTLTSEYYQFFLGGAGDYDAASSLERGELDQKGDGNRRSIAGFLQYELSPISRLQLVLGGRFDALRDEFTPEPPTQGEKQSTTHTAFSPKAGANFRYLDTPKQVGNLYANVSRSFKAPTLDQLYDQRSIPVEFPPFAITLSNGDLNPQFGTNLEVGVYHRATLHPNLLYGELSIAAYTMDIEDELDFDLQQFKYVNIGKSRHRGVETGLKLSLKSSANVFVNYTHQSVTSQLGEHEGNQLKAIPRNIISGGFNVAPLSGIGVGLVLKSVHDIYLDDANTITLPDYTTVDAKVMYQYGLIGAAFEVFNLFDHTYSATGFPDATGSGVVYFYPAVGRYFRVSLNVQM